MVVIIDMLDINRVLIDSTDGKMPRVIYPLKRLTLTKLKVAKVQRGCRTGTLRKLNKANDVVTAFKKTPASVKMEKFTKRSNLTDFERFQVMVLRKQRSFKAGHPKAADKPKKKSAAPAEKAPEKKKDVPPSPGKGGKKGDVPPSPGKGGKKGKGKKEKKN